MGFLGRKSAYLLEDTHVYCRAYAVLLEDIQVQCENPQYFSKILRFDATPLVGFWSSFGAKR